MAFNKSAVTAAFCFAFMTLPTPGVTEEFPQEFIALDVFVELENLLNDLYYFPGPIDGVIDRETYGSIWNFQSDNGFVQDGQLKPNELAALRSAASKAEAEGIKAVRPNFKPDSFSHVSRALTKMGCYGRSPSNVTPTNREAYGTAIKCYKIDREIMPVDVSNNGIDFLQLLKVGYSGHVVDPATFQKARATSVPLSRIRPPEGFVKYDLQFSNQLDAKAFTNRSGTSSCFNLRVEVVLSDHAIQRLNREGLEQDIWKIGRGLERGSLNRVGRQELPACSQKLREFELTYRSSIDEIVSTTVKLRVPRGTDRSVENPDGISAAAREILVAVQRQAQGSNP